MTTTSRDIAHLNTAHHNVGTAPPAHQMRTSSVTTAMSCTIGRLKPGSAFAAALQGEPCRVFGIGPGLDPMPAWRWRGDADVVDHELLRRCLGATVDIGCGPGRMTHALLELGQTALGIDIVPEAVRQTRERGGIALQRDVFSALPGEGRWETALLADGNIGIGGDPHRLLRRVHDLIVDRGRVVIDLSKPGGAISVHQIGLEVGGRRSCLFPWAIVPADQIERLAVAASLRVLEVVGHQGRWFATLEKHLSWRSN